MIRRRLVAAILIVLGMVGGYVLLGFYYKWVEIPLIRWRVSQIPGVEFVELRDFGPRGESDPEVVLLVQNKGQLVLQEPTLASFSGGGPIVVTGIGDCAKSFNIVVTAGDSRYPDLSFNTVSELVASYDRVYQLTVEKDLCAVWQPNRIARTQ